VRHNSRNPTCRAVDEDAPDPATVHQAEHSARQLCAACAIVVGVCDDSGTSRGERTEVALPTPDRQLWRAAAAYSPGVPRWLMAGIAVVALAVLGVIALSDDESSCSASETVYDGNVAPGGPQTADEALAAFLSVGPHINPGTGDPMASDPDHYERTEVGDDTVIFTAGELSLGASHRPNGWLIGGATTTC
jgi:hypothetical protein